MKCNCYETFSYILLAALHLLDFLLLNGKDHNPHYTAEAVAYKNEFFKHHSRLKKKGLLETDEQRSMLIDFYDWHKMTEQDEAVWQEIFAHLDDK